MRQRGPHAHAALSKVKEWNGINYSCFFNPKKESLLVFQNNSTFGSYLPLAALGKVYGPRNYSGKREMRVLSCFSDHSTDEFREMIGR